MLFSPTSRTSGGLIFPEIEKLTKKIKNSVRDKKKLRRKKERIATDQYKQKKKSWMQERKN